MWIFSQHGFYSIVRINHPTMDFAIRSRDRQDLVKAIKCGQTAGLPQIGSRKIIETNGSDYRFRIFVTTDELTVVLDNMIARLEYPNFKNRIMELRDQAARVGLYSRIWNLVKEYFDNATIQPRLYDKFRSFQSPVMGIDYKTKQVNNNKRR